MPLRPALALAATVLLWGSAFAAIRAALEHFSAAHLSVLRLLVATLALCAIAAARGVRLPARRDLPAIAAVGFAGMTAYQLLLNSGERTVPAGTASLLVNLSPVFTAIGASLWLGEEMTRRRWTGVAVACGGATLIALAGNGGLSLEQGALLVLGAAVVQAAFFLAQKPLLRRYGSLELTTWAMALGALMALPFARRAARGDRVRAARGAARRRVPGRRRERDRVRHLGLRVRAGRRLGRGGDALRGPGRGVQRRLALARRAAGGAGSGRGRDRAGRGRAGRARWAPANGGHRGGRVRDAAALREGRLRLDVDIRRKLATEQRRDGPGPSSKPPLT